MDILESIKMAAKTLVANKLRSSLTMLGIIIGNASVIAMVGVGEGTQKLATEEFESLGPNVLFIRPGSQRARRTSFDLPKTLVLADAEAIAAQVPTATNVAPQIDSRQLVNYRQQNNNTQISGTTPAYPLVRNFVIDQGRFINQIDLKRNNRVAVLGSEIAERFFRFQDPIGQQIRIKNISFKIIGVMESKGAFLGINQDETVYIPLTTMANQIVGRTSVYGTEVSFISVSARDKQSVRAAKFQIENLLRLRHQITDEDDFTVRTPKQILSIVDRVTAGLTILLAAIASISLLVGGIGVMNIMLVSVTERTQEIGLRKAVGAKERDILIQFLIEAIILSVIGGVVGTSIGLAGIIFIAAISPLSATVSPFAIVVAFGVSSSIGLFFGVVPAKQAANLDPIVALRSA